MTECIYYYAQPLPIPPSKPGNIVGIPTVDPGMLLLMILILAGAAAWAVRIGRIRHAMKRGTSSAVPGGPPPGRQ